MDDKYDQLKSNLSKHFEVFCSQDVENGFFDVVFQLGDEKLYAHKHMLAGVSKPFAVMFSERWTTNDEPIKISTCSFDVFKEFIGQIYYSECKLTNQNIFAMVDMAEFYDVAGMKTLCDEFLAKMEITPENIFQMFGFAQKYSSLSKFYSSVASFMIQNLSTFMESNGLMKIKKEMIKAMVDIERSEPQEEKLFEFVYKWAEYQAVIKQSSTEKEAIDINQAIKDEMSEILPKISFERMSFDFLFMVVVPKGLFTPQHLSDILIASKNEKGFAKVVSSNGKTLNGKLDSSVLMDVYDTIKLINGLEATYVDHDYIYWNTKRPLPSKPSQLKKNDNVKYYLIFDNEGDLAVKETSQLLDGLDYLLAELAAEDGFKLTSGCQIEAFHKF